MRIHIYYGYPTSAAAEWLLRRHSYEDTHILDHPFEPEAHPITRALKFRSLVDTWREQELKQVAVVVNCPLLIQDIESLPECKGYETVYLCSNNECVPLLELPGIDHHWAKEWDSFVLGAATVLTSFVNWDNLSGNHPQPESPTPIESPEDRLVFLRTRTHSPQWEVYAMPKEATEVPAGWRPAKGQHPLARVTERFFTEGMRVRFYGVCGTELSMEHEEPDRAAAIRLILQFLHNREA